MSPQLPARARVVVIGGGVIGASIAYHLAHAGWADTLVLERHSLTSGTTWHAAGLMTCFGSTSETNTAMRLYSRDLYARLEEETGQSTGFRAVGLIEAAADEDRLHEYRRVAAYQRRLGLVVEEITPTEIAERFPFAKVDDLLAGFWVPGDGRVNPVDVTMALARGAKQLGVQVIEGVSVHQVLTERRGGVDSVVGVRTSAGDLECEFVVNCAGMWARELGERNGVVIPNQAAEHYYLITDTVAGLTPDMPVFEDPAAYGYYREEGGGMMVGLFEPAAAAWRPEGTPADFAFGELSPDWERMGPFLEMAMARVPITQEVGIRKFFCGPESFTPDLAPAVGEAPGMRGYFVTAGLNSVGILSAGGMGRIVAQWISSGRPDVDVTGFNLDRFHRYQLAPAYRAARTAEVLGTVYAAHTPGTQLRTGRGVRRSAVHDRLAAQGALFRDVTGWESADYYAGPGRSPEPEPSWGRAGWFERWEAEHRAVREGVGLMDMSFMAKYLVTGPDAGAFLDRLSGASVNGPSGEIVYTQWLGEDGRLEADLTVTKLADDEFLVVASDTAAGHVLAWMQRQVGEDRVAIQDVTTAYCQLNVQGPRSRDLLAEVVDSDLSTQAFPFRTARWVHIGCAPVLLVRITYLGELGYELYIPTEMAVHVYELLTQAGERHGLEHVGLRSLSSLRMEKAYRDYGHDIDNTDCPLEVGLGFALDLEKPGGFIGRDAVLARKDAAKAVGGHRSRLVQILLTDPEPLMYHAEIVYRDGIAVGDVRAASYGWTLGGAVGLAFVTHPAHEGIANPEWLRSGDWEVDIAGERYAAQVSLAPMYDPKNERIKI
ncbi:MAG: FAD-dependent oxidoreductase [Micrococcales bacterium]|nr:FAD-dependent oxidoreductase [Micrococcales bacterium]